MSISAYELLTTGSAISWTSGGNPVITATSLANGSARQGGKSDMGANWARQWAVLLKTSLASAGTNGTIIELWWSPSDSATAGTDNAGGASGADGSYGTPAEYKRHLVGIGALEVSNNAGTGIQKVWFPEIYIPMRYGSPVLVNLSGQALGGTAGDHEIRFVPAVGALGSTITG